MRLKPTVTFSLPYVAALIALTVATWLIEKEQWAQTEKALGETLVAVSDFTQKSLRDWSQSRIANAQAIAQLPALVNASDHLLQQMLDGQLSQGDPVHQNLRGEIDYAVSSLGYLGYFIIAPNGLSLSSMADHKIGEINVIARYMPDKIRAATAGDSLLTAPMQAISPTINAAGDLAAGAATMFVLTPIYGNDRSVKAILALRINPYLEFSAIFARGRTGLTGETYAFNRDGTLISESRFNQHLARIGLIAANQSSSLNVEIRDPGRNLLTAPASGTNTDWPLTRMAAAAVQGVSGTDLRPYRDYRGVQVVGTWRWDTVMSLGIATEIDAKEAFAQQRRHQAVLRTFAAAIAVLIVTLGVYQERSRRKSYRQGRELIRAKEKAELANRAKMEFLSGMSHDLRTPLNAVIGFTQLLSLEKSIQSNAKQKQHLEYIERSGEHLLTMLNEILEFATMDIGELSFELEAIPPIELVEDCLSMVAKDATERSIRLQIQSDLAELPPILADITRARQVLGNLLSNAVKYNRRAGEVQIQASVQSANLRIEVKDTGPGIPEDRLKDLWEPFNRLGAEKTTVQGTGIGLAFSKALIEGMSGEIGAESQPSVGSVFWFELPIAEAATRAEEEGTNDIDEETDPVEILHNKNILYVEDVDINQVIIRTMLKDIPGLTLVCADDGAAGLQALREGHFDLLLLDIQLPDMNGFEWNKRRLTENLATNAPAIAVSADITPESQAKAKAEGLVDFIEKPVKLDVLIAALVAALQGR